MRKQCNGHYLEFRGGYRERSLNTSRYYALTVPAVLLVLEYNIPQNPLLGTDAPRLESSPAAPIFDK